MTGGGFGGCIVAAVPSHAAQQLGELITKACGQPVYRQSSRSAGAEEAS